MKQITQFMKIVVLGLGVSTTTQTMAMNPEPEDVVIDIPVIPEPSSPIQQIFAEKDLSKIFDSLYTSISETVTQTQTAPQLLFSGLMNQTISRLEKDISYYSYGKKWITGQSNTLFVLGVLRNVTTRLAIPLDYTLNEKIDGHLKYIKFYQSAIFMDMGSYGFHVPSGQFVHLNDSYYLYPECMTTVERIYNLFHE